MTTAKYISKILFDNNLDKNSYLNGLPIIKYLADNQQLSFFSNITFFVGDTASKTKRCGAMKNDAAFGYEACLWHIDRRYVRFVSYKR